MSSNRKWTGKSKGSKTGHQIFVFLLRHFGLKPAYFLLYFVAFFYFLTSWKTNFFIYVYFRKLNYNKIRSFFSIYRNYYVFGQTLIDRISVMAGFDNKFTFYFDGEDYLLQIVKEKKSGILLSAHAGNWEIAGHYLDRLDTSINILMLDEEYKHIKDYLNNITHKRKANIIEIKEDQSHLYKILDALNKNELICIHSDRLLYSGQQSISLPFLGTKAPFPYSIFKMIVSFNIPVSFVFAFKENNLHYHFYATPAKQYNGTDKEKEIRNLSLDYVKELEAKLRQYPLQWFNYFNFWEGN